MESSRAAASSPRVVCAGLSPAQIEVIRPLVKYPVLLATSSLLEPPSKLRRLAHEADLLLIHWDGLGQMTHRLLLSLRSHKRALSSTIYLIHESDETVMSPLTSVQMADLGATDLLRLPEHAETLKKVIDRLSDGSDGIGGTDGTDGTGPDPKNQNPSDLRLAIPQGPDWDVTLERALRGLAKSRNSHRTARTLDPLGTHEHLPIHGPLLVFDVEKAGAHRLAGMWQKATSFPVTPCSEVDAVMAALRHDHGPLVIFFDGVAPGSDQLLDHLDESRQIVRTPILILVPSINVAQRHSERIKQHFFDAIGLFDGKSPQGLKDALDRLFTASLSPDSPRALLERMRHPMRLTTPPSERIPIPVPALADLATSLQKKPGKGYWALSETIPHLLAQGRKKESLEALSQVSAMAPQAFNTLILHELVKRQALDIRTDGEDFVRTMLKVPHLTVDRLYRVGLTIERWGDLRALKTLIEDWSHLPHLGQDPTLSFVAGRYYLLLGELEKAAPFLCHAVDQDPGRLDFAEGLAQMLASSPHREMAAPLLKALSSRETSTWETRMLAQQVLSEQDAFRGFDSWDHDDDHAAEAL